MWDISRDGTISGIYEPNNLVYPVTVLAKERPCLEQNMEST